MTEDEFRRIALSFPDVVEGAHGGHPDFRVGGKVFASLQPAKGLGMAKLTPELQGMFISSEPGVYTPASGSWGLKGATMVTLSQAEQESVEMALCAAWENTAPKTKRA